MTESSPEPIYNCFPYHAAEKGIGIWVTLIIVHIPQVIKPADIAYCWRLIWLNG